MGGGGYLQNTKSSIRVYDFVGIPRTRVWHTEYRLRMVGIRRTRKGGVQAQ